MPHRYSLVCTLMALTFSVFAQVSLLADLNMSSNNSSAPDGWAALDDERFVFGAAGPINFGIFPAKAWASDGTAAGTFRLSDVDVEREFIQLNDIVLFSGKGTEGKELWRTDGTEEGTFLLKDINPGSEWSSPADFNLLSNGLVVFGAETEDEGRELWLTDGTTEGTRLLLDVFPGPLSGYNGEAAVIDDSLLFFRGTDVADNQEPWRTNGTPEGTWKIAEVNTGELASQPAFFTKSGDWIYFSALAVGVGRELHRTSGQMGSFQVINEGTGSTDSSNPFDLTDVDGQLFFVADGVSPAGTELWTFNHVGTEATLLSPSGNSFPRNLYALNGKLIFASDPSNGSAGNELWVSDGTVGGTQMIIDLYPGENDGIFGGSGPSLFTVVGDHFYFAGADGTTSGIGGLELFRTDGTAAGTELVMDYRPGPSGSNPENFFHFNDRLYFGATLPEIGVEPHYIGLPDPSSLRRYPDDDVLVTIYPNPIGSNASTIYLNTELTKATGGHLRLLEVSGRSATPLQEFHLPAGRDQLELNIPSGLPAGTYFVEFIAMGSRPILLPVIKQ